MQRDFDPSYPEISAMIDHSDLGIGMYLQEKNYSNELTCSQSHILSIELYFLHLKSILKYSFNYRQIKVKKTWTTYREGLNFAHKDKIKHQAKNIN